MQAKHFIYIENQYFLGGSGEWQSLDTPDICNHLVPIEVRISWQAVSDVFLPLRLRRCLSSWISFGRASLLQIALKIVEKIRAGEHFAAYITIPLFPEGASPRPITALVRMLLH